jgi:hypothetical protein
MDKSLGDLENSVYGTAYADGLVDLLFGSSLLWIGVIWIMAPDLAGVAGVLPAVLVPTVLPVRKQIVEARGGYVKWSEPRRRWERRNVFVLAIAGVVMFLLGLGMFFAFNSRLGADAIEAAAPGLLAFILAIGAVLAGLLFGTWRPIAYAAMLVAGGIMAVIADANPGWPLLVVGVVVTTVAVAMLVRFLRQNPRVEMG